MNTTKPQALIREGSTGCAKRYLKNFPLRGWTRMSAWIRWMMPIAA